MVTIRNSVIALALAAPLTGQSDAERLALVSQERIWDRAPHSAFTSLQLWNGELWCAFREGSGHVPGTNGIVRILVERDGLWRSAAVLDEAGIDLRDPKLSVTPDNRLMVIMGGSRYRGRERIGMATRVSFTSDSTAKFSAPLPIRIDPAIASPHDWLWRVTWHENRGYGTVYQGKTSGPEIHLLTTTDGVEWSHITRLDLDGRANETTLRFLPDGRMVALVRREEGDRRGKIGVASAPFEEWTFRELPIRLGGPDLIVVPRWNQEPALIAATREYAATGPRTMLGAVTLDGEFQPLLRLPSRGDTSYAGLVLQGDRLHVSYYSSHGARTSIYRTVLRLPELLKLR